MCSITDNTVREDVVRRILDFVGAAVLFGLKVTAAAFQMPFELDQIWRHIGEFGVRSLALVASCGLALGVVITLHTRSTLIMFGATGMSPKLQSLGFFCRNWTVSRCTFAGGSGRREYRSCIGRYASDRADRRARGAID